jgi:hypothetical protein
MGSRRNYPSENTPVAGKAICPICEKRRAERYCPAKGEKICAVDCGTEREVSIDCPTECSYLQTAHRWERDLAKPLAESEVPFPDVSLPEELPQTGQPVLSGFVLTTLVYARDHRSLNDADAFAAMHALADTFRTLVSGIYYEKPPEYPVAAGLYAALAKFIEDEKKRAAERPEFPSPTDEQLFHLLVLFLRLCRLRSNGRPRTRSFIEFLRVQFPLEAAPAREESRIIVP